MVYVYYEGDRRDFWKIITHGQLEPVPKSLMSLEFNQNSRKFSKSHSDYKAGEFGVFIKFLKTHNFFSQFFARVWAPKSIVWEHM